MGKRSRRNFWYLYAALLGKVEKDETLKHVTLSAVLPLSVARPGIPIQCQHGDSDVVR